MSTNCLVTKLKGSVEGITEYFNAFTLDLQSGNHEISLGNTSGKEKRIIGDGYFCSDNTYSDNLGDSVTTATVYIKVTNPCKLVVFDEYQINEMNNGTSPNYIGGDFSFLKYRTFSKPFVIKITSDSEFNINNFNFIENYNGMLYIATNAGSQQKAKLTGDIAAFSQIKSSKITMTKNHLYGNISVLANNPNYTNIELYNNDINGNIETLTNLVDIVVLNIGMSNIQGSVETLLEGLWRNGKRTNITSLGCHTSNCTFHGSTWNGIDFVVAFDNNGITVTAKAGTKADLPATFDGTTWHYAND